MSSETFPHFFAEDTNQTQYRGQRLSSPIYFDTDIMISSSSASESITLSMPIMALFNFIFLVSMCTNEIVTIQRSTERFQALLSIYMPTILEECLYQFLQIFWKKLTYLSVLEIIFRLIHHVSLFPNNIQVFPPHMTIGSKLLVNRLP